MYKYSQFLRPNFPHTLSCVHTPSHNCLGMAQTRKSKRKSIPTDFYGDYVEEEDEDEETEEEEEVRGMKRKMTLLQSEDEDSDTPLAQVTKKKKRRPAAEEKKKKRRPAEAEEKVAVVVDDEKKFGGTKPCCICASTQTPLGDPDHQPWLSCTDCHQTCLDCAEDCYTVSLFFSLFFSNCGLNFFFARAEFRQFGEPDLFLSCLQEAIGQPVCLYSKGKSWRGGRCEA